MTLGADTQERSRDPRAALSLIVAVAGAVAAHWRALSSPFFADDYVYLYSVRERPFVAYVKDALVPGVTWEWRPLYFLSFQLTYRLFGDAVIGYHLVNLGIHIAAIVLVWRLARRFVAGWEAGALAVTIFAVHPTGFDAVAWISSVNIAALPLTLAAWLAFMAAVEGRTPCRTWQHHVLALGLLALALGFHETAATAFPALGFWYLLVFARGRLRTLRTYYPLLPYVLLAAAYMLLRTQLFSAPLARTPFAFGSQIVPHAYQYLQSGFWPAAGLTPAAAVAVGRICAGVVLAVLVAALLGRHWLLTALVLCFASSLLPFVSLLGLAERYWYTPRAYFALMASAAFHAGAAVARRHNVHRALVSTVAAALASLIAVAGTAATSARLADWVYYWPAVHQHWVDQLRHRFPALPPGSTLYVTKTPGQLVIFGDAVLRHTVSYYYPHVARVVNVPPHEAERVRARLGPSDRLFAYDMRRE